MNTVLATYKGFCKTKILRFRKLLLEGFMSNLLGYCRYLYRLRRTNPGRYANLFKIIFEHRCRRILEIGTYDGAHAIRMIQTAGIHYPVNQIEYVGFDLFELLTDEKCEEEFAKRPPHLFEVESRLKKTGANVTLYQGNTRTALPKAKNGLGIFDFIFIDGGHSVATISSDWNSVRELIGDKTIVIFDDYYINPDSRLDGLGCQKIIDSLDKNLYEVQVLKPKDTFVKEWGILEVNFVKVIRK